MIRTLVRQLVIIVSILAVMTPSFAFGNTASDELLKINDEISQKKAHIEDLRGQINSYQDTIDSLQDQELSLENELALIDNRIAKIGLDIEETQANIEETALEIEGLDNQITAAGSRLESDRSVLSNLVRQLDREDDRTALEAFLLNENLSAIFNRAKFLEDVQGDLLKTVRRVQDEKEGLTQKRGEREEKNTELRDTKDRLKIQLLQLSDIRDSKQYLIDQTQSSEFQFRNAVSGLRDEEANVNDDISKLEQKARERLNNADKFPEGEVILSWPVPDHTVTTQFHDPDYPFRRVFEHPGVDIRSPQGSPVRAAAPGYVLKVHDGGYDYSYIIILHANGLTSVYGHLSRLDAKPDTYIERGDVIGLSGAMPGTRGAGKLTTGPHLHFEVRLNGVPVNPLDYLID